MNNNKKKTMIQVLVAILIFGGLYFGIKTINKPKVTIGEKSIEIVILDKDLEPVLKESFNTDVQVLGELLDEVNKDKGDLFKFQGSKDDEFGRFIDQVTLVESTTGEFWVYESDNNKVCVNEGYCPGIDMLAIEDENSFSFMIVKP